jgi:hypothetical protein
VTNLHWNDTIQKVVTLGEHSILQSPFNVIYITLFHLTQQQPVLQYNQLYFEFEASWSSGMAVYIYRVVQRPCVAECKITVLNGKVLFHVLNNIHYWSKSKYIEYTIMASKFTFYLMYGHSVCATNLAMLLVWQNANSVSHALSWTDKEQKLRLLFGSRV